MTEPPKPKLSVVLATYNRADTVRRTLELLADQDLSPDDYEVIVIDDGSSDNTAAVVHDAQSSVRFELNYLQHQNRGPGYTQNRGIRASRAPLILLMADDIFMTRGVLSAHLRAHALHPEPFAAVLGRVVQSPELTQSVFLRTWDSFRFSDFDQAELVEVPYYRFWACNISVKRDFVLANGMFREQKGRAGPAAHEDPELGYRLHLAGLRIFYDPAALGYHHHVVTRETACARAYQQGLNFDEFRSLAPAPEIPVAYHDLRRQTVADHMRAWFGPARKHLAGNDRNPAIAIGRYAVRGVVFNRVTIRHLWEPLFERAERDPAVANLMRPIFYRGLIAYHFRRGCRDGNQRFVNCRIADENA